MNTTAQKATNAALLIGSIVLGSARVVGAQTSPPSNPTLPTPPASPPTQRPASIPSTPPSLTPSTPNTLSNDRTRFTRPWAFQNPASEQAFNTSVRGLAQMETEMAQRQRAWAARMDEVGRLQGDERSTGMWDLMQQMIRDQEAMNRYMTQSRRLWTGDIDTQAMPTGR